jgi:hypothetical protein
MHCLLDVFSSLTCSRDNRGRRYDLSSVLALVLIAVLAGCKNHTQIYVFRKMHPRLLPKLNFRPPCRPRRKEDRSRITPPNEDTIASILDRVDKKELNEKLVAFLSRMIVRGASVLAQIRSIAVGLLPFIQ